MIDKWFKAFEKWIHQIYNILSSEWDPHVFAFSEKVAIFSHCSLRFEISSNKVFLFLTDFLSFSLRLPKSVLLCTHHQIFFLYFLDVHSFWSRFSPPLSHGLVIDPLQQISEFLPRKCMKSAFVMFNFVFYFIIFFDIILKFYYTILINFYFYL